jgi:hypothetical protein
MALPVNMVFRIWFFAWGVVAIVAALVTNEKEFCPRWRGGRLQGQKIRIPSFIPRGIFIGAGLFFVLLALKGYW